MVDYGWTPFMPVAVRVTQEFTRTSDDIIKDSQTTNKEN